LQHLGGSGLGSGTIGGLSKLILKGLSENSAAITDKMAYGGDASKVDLLMKDFPDSGSDLLPPDVTVSNFGGLKTNAADDDKALGICKTVFESILMMAVFAHKAMKNDIPIVLCGTVSKSTVLKRTAERLSELHGIDIVFPEDREFAGAIGAALVSKQKTDERKQNTDKKTIN
jgi:type II pantothenate kinase